MTTITLSDLKKRFSDILKRVKLGEEIAIVSGQKKEVSAYIVPKKHKDNQKPRPLGLLDGKVKIVFAEDFKMAERDLFSP
jgi:prevent-host-death family protein